MIVGVQNTLASRRRRRVESDDNYGLRKLGRTGDFRLDPNGWMPILSECAF